jgi:hypothetical protein
VILERGCQLTEQSSGIWSSFERVSLAELSPNEAVKKAISNFFFLIFFLNKIIFFSGVCKADFGDLILRCFSAFEKLPLSSRFVVLNPQTPDESITKVFVLLFSQYFIWLTRFKQSLDLFYSALLPHASAGLIDVVDGRFLHHVIRNKVISL